MADSQAKWQVSKN